MPGKGRRYGDMCVSMYSIDTDELIRGKRECVWATREGKAAKRHIGSLSYAQCAFTRPSLLLLL